MARLLEVSEFIKAESVKPFVWGKTDCASTVDRWLAKCCGVSPMLAYGRRFNDEIEARQWLGERYGIAVGMNRVMRFVGLLKTRSPAAGDVGLIIHDQKLCAAIHAGTYWFSHGENGLIGANLKAVWKAWSVPS